MQISIIPAAGLGDALIMHIAAHHLSLHGFEVEIVTKHDFGAWQSKIKRVQAPRFESIFLQYDNTKRSIALKKEAKLCYTFYGDYKLSKHGALFAQDYVCNRDLTMVDNVVLSLRNLFAIEADRSNGFCPPTHLIHRKYKKRVVLHIDSADPARNWPPEKFNAVYNWLKANGFEPVFLPQFPTLSQMLDFLYESSYFIGNDSGPGHAASLLGLPQLTIGREAKHMLHWRPGWHKGEVVTPWTPDWKCFRTNWKRFISKNKVIKTLKSKVLIN